MRGWSSIELGGNIGSDIVLRKMPNGKAVCDISLAVNSEKKDDPTEWYKVVFFGGAAETVAQFMKKGEPIRVNGRFRTEKYKAANGENRVALVCDVNEFSLLGDKKTQSSGAMAPETTNEIKVPF